jgi:hypothetical protein
VVAHVISAVAAPPGTVTIDAVWVSRWVSTPMTKSTVSAVLVATTHQVRLLVPLG